MALLDRDPGVLELPTTVKVSQNPLIGAVWHFMRLLARLGEWQRILVVTGIYFLYLITLTTFDRFGWPQWLQRLFIAVYLAFGLTSWMIPAVIGRLVAREQRRVRLSPRY